MDLKITQYSENIGHPVKRNQNGPRKKEPYFINVRVTLDFKPDWVLFLRTVIPRDLWPHLS